MSCLNTWTLASDNRTRSFTFTLYDDSCNSEWKQLINDDHIPFLYAFHDKDEIITGDSVELKKPHYHVVISFDNKKSLTQIQAICDRYGAANGAWMNVVSMRSIARYLCHLDNPDKYRYDPSIVIASGLDYVDLINSQSDKYLVVEQLMDFIDKHHVYSFAKLLRYCSVHNREWFIALCNNCAYVIKDYLQGRYWDYSRYRSSREQPDGFIPEDLSSDGEITFIP